MRAYNELMQRAADSVGCERWIKWWSELMNGQYGN
jgi:hypothetical protein